MKRRTGSWIERERRKRADGGVRVVYRAVVCIAGKRIRRRFRDEMSARAWIDGLGDRRAKARDIRGNWRFVFGDDAASSYERERRFS